MAKTWYPVVDYLACEECGACVTKCPHGVYDRAKAPTPVVIHPGSCVDHCHTCGNRCPQGAITYVGENTGWQPPQGKREEDEPCCACGSGCACGADEAPLADKVITVDFLYLDLKTCERCMGTEDVLTDAIAQVSSVLEAAGYSVVLHKVEIVNEQLARQYQFLSSPTLRINGRDLCLDVKENACGSCGDISGQLMNCRVFTYEGGQYDVPPKAMIINGILKAVYGEEQAPAAQEPYTVPENISKFFSGRDGNRTGCCCGGDCGE